MPLLGAPGALSECVHAGGHPRCPAYHARRGQTSGSARTPRAVRPAASSVLRCIYRVARFVSKRYPIREFTTSGAGRQSPRFSSGALPRTRHGAGVSRRRGAWSRRA
jgi:hypothetical protein